MAFRWVVDANGVDRRVYNLRARWRSARAQRDFPRPVYRAICRTATGMGDAERPRPPHAADTQSGEKRLLFIGAAIFLAIGLGGISRLLERTGTGDITIREVLALIVGLSVGAAYLLALCFPVMRRPLPIAPWRLTSPLQWEDDGQMAAAMVVNGRCPSCAYPVDPSKPREDGAVVCAECGGAWVVVRRGGELRLGR